MSLKLSPKVNTLPLLVSLSLVLLVVMGVLSWSLYDQQKQLAQQTLSHAIQTQKHYLDNLLQPVSTITNSRRQTTAMQQAINQAQQLWDQETRVNPNLSLRLTLIPSNGSATEKGQIILSSQGSAFASISSTLSDGQEHYITQYTDKLFAPFIMRQQLELATQLAAYQIQAQLRFPSVVEFLISISHLMLLAFLSALFLAWLAILLWKKRLVRFINDSQTRYQQFVENANDWLWEVNQHGVITFAGENSRKILGYSANEMVGRPLEEFLYQATAEKDKQNLATYFNNAADIINTNFHFASQKGTPLLLRFNAMAVKDRQGKLICYRGTGSDLTEVMQKQDSMISMVFYDGLTQLPNRQKLVQRLDEHLNQVIQRKELILSALLFVDLDDFKEINDIQGQESGNEILKSTSDRLSRLVNGTEMIYRFSGDQFVILVISPNKMLMNEFRTKLEAFVNEVLMTINQPFEIEDQNIILTASVGITMIPQDGRTTKELFSHGENAISQAKRNGKNRLCYFDASMRELELHRKQRIKRIKQATEQNDFKLHYQLQIDSETDEIYGMEALIRWPNQGNETLNPQHFIQLAVESNHIQAIDEWVIKEATKDLAYFYKVTNKIIPVSINLSSKTIENAKLKTLLMSEIEKHFLSPHNLRIEITETGLLKNIEKTILALNELKAMGFESNIDDFGTGYSSLSYLQKLPVDTLKIDKSFIDGIASNPKDMEICQSIIHLGKTLNKKIIAEGVQTVQQKELLKAEGCHLIQGYYYYRPMPMQEIITASMGRDIAQSATGELTIKPDRHNTEANPDFDLRNT